MTPSLGVSVDLLEDRKTLRDLDKLKQWSEDLFSEWALLLQDLRLLTIILTIIQY